MSHLRGKGRSSFPSRPCHPHPSSPPSPCQTSDPSPPPPPLEGGSCGRNNSLWPLCSSPVAADNRSDFLDGESNYTCDNGNLCHDQHQHQKSRGNISDVCFVYTTTGTCVQIISRKPFVECRTQPWTVTDLWPIQANKNTSDRREMSRSVNITFTFF